MKKIIALVFALVMVMSFSVTAFALDSASASEVTNVTVINGENTTKENVVVKKDGTVSVSADSAKGKFNSWSVYVLVNGVAKLAVEGKDYVYVSGDKAASNAVIKPLADIVICGNYDGKVTSPTSTSTSTTSPSTADAVAGVVLMMMAAVACGVVAKKQLAK